MNEFQTRIQEAYKQAQSKATARAKEWEKEARKVLETLGDRAQTEFRGMLKTAERSSREQLAALGVELEKLGKKLQEMATAPVAKPPEAAHAADEKATQPAPGSVQ